MRSSVKNKLPHSFKFQNFQTHDISDKNKFYLWSNFEKDSTQTKVNIAKVINEMQRLLSNLSEPLRQEM